MLRTILILFGLSLAALVISGLLFTRAAFFGTPIARASLSVELQAHMKAGEVGEALKEKGIIGSSLGYRLYSFIDKAASRAKAGEYRFQPGSSYRLIARAVALGPERKESQVTLIEGWTVDDIVAYLHQEKNVAPDQTVALIGRSADRAAFDAALRQDFAFLKPLPRTRSLEGYLFPETYRIWDDQLPDGLIRKQLAEFEKRFGAAQVTAKSAPLKSLDEVIILASIVEKEVQSPEDRKHVAGIFLNRLKDGMALQSDATLTYVNGSKRGRATANELATDSPYNSYKNRGLPPGPISNPGASAIEAVLDPDVSNDLYFLTDAQGKVFYARTLEEHVLNKQKAGY